MALINDIADIVFGRRQEKQADPIGGLPVALPWDRKAFPTPSFRYLSLEGLKNNSAIFACASVLLRTYPEPPPMVYERQPDGADAELQDHDLKFLLDHPNPYMSSTEFSQFMILYRMISGSCYIYKVRNKLRRVVALYPYSDAVMTPVAGDVALVDHFDYTLGGGTTLSIPAEDVIHLRWFPDPDKPWTGLGPMRSILREIATDSEATSYLYSLLKNDAIPPLALVLPPKAEALGNDKRERMRKEFEDRHGGQNRGKIAIVEGGADLKPIASNMREMMFESLRRVPEARVCAAFGVPPVVAGLNIGLDQMTENNVEGMKTQYTELTLIPLWISDGKELTQALAPEFYNGRRELVIKFDISAVQALQTRLREKREWARGALSAGGITVNEFREVSGWPPVENGDVFLRSPLTIEMAAILKAAAGRDRQAKTAPPGRSEAEKAAARSIGRSLRTLREEGEGRFESALADYFKSLSDRVCNRVRAAEKAGRRCPAAGKATGDDWITEDDVDELKGISNRYTLALLKESWPVINAALGVTLAWDENDSAVLRALSLVGNDIVDITDATRELILDTIKRGYDAGLSIDQIVRGDADFGFRGLADIVDETYKGRATTIARTELGTAQNEATVARYENSGIKRVYVLDGDGPNSCEVCQQYAAGNIIWTLEESQRDPLEHPRCIRAFAPVVE